MRIGLVGVLLILCAGPSRAMQNPFLVVSAEDSGDDFGHDVDGGYDVDGDGHDDLLVSAWLASLQGTGAVSVFSGADGHVIHQWVGDLKNDLFGTSVAFADDTNGDGIADILVAARAPTNNPSYARLFSGADGSTLFTFSTLPGDGANASFESVAGLGDVNGDGYGDIVLLSRLNAVNDGRSLQIRSGIDGSLLYSNQVVGSTEDIVRGTGDTNGDGVPDFIVGDEYFHFSVSSGGSTTNYFTGAARIRSGLDGAVLQEWIGAGPYDHLGDSVDGVGDMNRDGYADVVVGAKQFGGPDGPGYVRAYSGFDGSVLFEWTGDAAGQALGFCVSAAGDVDGDGYPDVLMGDVNDYDFVHKSGSLRVHSGRDGSLLFQFCKGAGFLKGLSPGYPPLGAVAGRAGDLDGDGRDDVVVIRNIYSGANSDLKAIWAVSGRNFAWHDMDGVAPAPHLAPRLSACGVIESGGTVSVLLTDAPPLRETFLVAGAKLMASPFVGGVLAPSPDIIAGPWLTNFQGALELTAHGFSSPPPDFELYVQALCVVPAGISVSNVVGTGAAGP